MDDSVVVILLAKTQKVIRIFGNHNKEGLTFTLTRAPITPREVRRRYSKGRVLEVVLRKGYKNNGIWASV